ncbi:hypothetical protein J4E91_006859 [Alternaria rosae]|nr:hypothetical protein J4E91_006859 [Alternaria rosae]
MASRKRAAPSSAGQMSANKRRDVRARRRTATRDPGFFDRTTEVNAVNSPLLRLPAELRTMIYTYVFSFQEYRIDAGITGPIICAGSLKRNNMGLLLVSRQLHAETALLPYQLGTICFHFEGSYPDGLWLPHIGKFLEKRSLQQIKAIVSLQAYLYAYGDLWKILNGSGLYWANRKAVLNLGKKSL